MTDKELLEMYESRARFARTEMTSEEYTRLESLLSKQKISKIPCNLYRYAVKKAQKSSFQALFDVFNYGYIMGQRAERARRKGGVDNDSRTACRND